MYLYYYIMIHFTQHQYNMNSPTYIVIHVGIIMLSTKYYIYYDNILSNILLLLLLLLFLFGGVLSSHPGT